MILNGAWWSMRILAVHGLRQSIENRTSWLVAGGLRHVAKAKGREARSDFGFGKGVAAMIYRAKKQILHTFKMLTFCFPKTGCFQVLHIDAYCKKHQRTTGEHFMSSNAIFPAEVILQMFVIMWRVGHQVQAECWSFFPRNFPLPEKNGDGKPPSFLDLWSQVLLGCHPFFHPQRLQALQAMNHWLILMFLVLQSWEQVTAQHQSYPQEVWCFRSYWPLTIFLECHVSSRCLR